jgi:2,3-bisphosphoglycerate-independent phosphoglycerate mutase
MPMNSVIVLFLDGVGLGAADPEANPFMHVTMPTLQSLVGITHATRDVAGTVAERAALLGLDAGLGVPGLPQSATGQTTILTGHNAPATIGRHDGPYPDRQLREMLIRDSLFKTLLEAGQPVAYANAYPDRFLDRVKRGKGRLSANTQAAYRANLKLRSGQDLRRGRAISAFLSNEFWPEPELQLPSITARQAGTHLAALAKEHTLTFFEFWYSDLVGHKRDRERSLHLLQMLDDFLAGITATIDLAKTLLLVVSDHGNFEDWTTAKHTHNPAFTLLAGANFHRLVPHLNTLTDLKPAILTHIFGNSRGDSSRPTPVDRHVR